MTQITRHALLVALGVALMSLVGGCAQSVAAATPETHEVRTVDPGLDVTVLDVPLSAQVPLRQSPAAWTQDPDWSQSSLALVSAESNCQPACLEKLREQCCEDRFRFTTIRLWSYQNFVPDKSDPKVFGIEADSAWGWGCWDVTNISYIEFADYPQAIPGRPAGNEAPGVGAATGLTDFLSAFLFSRKKGPGHHGPHHFAAGFACQLPTASDDTLGSGKWAVGPAIEYEYECGRFFAAFVALNLFSVAGDEDRKGINMFMLKPMITYELSRRWKAVYMPYGITVYWEKPIDDAVYLPLGGGIQYEFKIGSLKSAASLQLFQYVLRSKKGPQQDLRFMLEFDF